MTAIFRTNATTVTQDVDVLAGVEEMIAGLDDFLRDPIGYGDYDFGDPISLGEFSSVSHIHGDFVARLT